MINKNISIWRGSTTPPTNYHLWEKEDGGLYVYLDEKWQHLIAPNDKTLLDEHLQQLNKIKDLAITEVAPTNTNTYKSYLLKSGDNIFGTTIDIPKDRFIKLVTLGYDNATIDESTGEITIGTGLSKEYLLFSVALESGSYELVSINLTNFLTEKDYSDGLEVVDNKLKVKVDPNSEEYLKVTNNGIKVEGINTKVSDTVNDIKNKILNGEWLSLKQGRKSDGTLVPDSIAMGYKSEATGYGSAALGYNCKASGENSHAEGINTLASGNNSHAEGQKVQATGEVSHAEGFLSRATASHAHAEGFDSEAGGEKSHAEGYQTVTSAVGSHAEGFKVQAKNAYSHAEGNATIADGQSSHAEGVSSHASNEGAHAEGNSIASGLFSHSENISTASGAFSHSEGNSRASGDYSHAEGSGCKTEDNQEDELKVGSYCHVEGIGTICISKGGHTEGSNTVVAGNFAHAEGVSSRADGTASHAEGKNTIANGDSAHAQGRFNVGNKYYIHSIGIGNENERKNAEYIYVNTDNAADPRNGYIYIYGIGGYDGIYADNTKYKSLQEIIKSIEIANANFATKTDLEKYTVWTKGSGNSSIVAIGDGMMIHPTASGKGAVAEGNGTASDYCSHAEGSDTIASGYCSHAEGSNTTASGYGSHAEGNNTTASGSSSHAEGVHCIARGFDSHAEGSDTIASGYGSHAEGWNTIASGYGSHAEGFFNYADASFINMVGVGDSTNKKNASVIYIGLKSSGNIDTSAQKHGYQYLIDVGGYKGQEIGDAKSVQEVFADLENNKVDKVEGKSLVSDTDITKLSELPSNSDLNNRLDTKLDASAYVIDTELSDTSPHPVQNKIVNSAIAACIKKIDITTITNDEIDGLFE